MTQPRMRLQFLLVTSTRLFGAGLQAVAAIILARLAGPAAFAAVAISISLVSVALALADWGMSSFLSREYAGSRRTLLSMGLRLNNIGACVVAAISAVVFMGAFWSGAAEPNALLLLLLCVGLSLEKIVETTTSLLIAAGDSIGYAGGLILRRLMFLLLFLSIILMAQTDAVLAYCISSFTAAFFGVLYNRVRVAALELPDPDGGFRSVLRAGLPFALTNASAQVRLLDVPILGLILSTTTVGAYSAVQRLTSPLLLVAGSLGAVVLPHSARSASGRVLRGVRISLISFVAASLVASVLAPWAKSATTILLGSEYTNSWPILVWGLIGSFFVGGSSVLGSALQGVGFELFVTINGWIFAVLTLVGVVFGALAFGANGAAASVAICYMIKCVSMWLYVESRFRRGEPRSVELAGG